MAILAQRLRFGPFVELAKPRIAGMVVLTAGLGYYLAGRGIPAWAPFVLTLLGTGLSAGGAAVLNNFLEREIDARMARTRGRALPAGLVEPAAALAAGVLLVLGGVSLLAWRVNLLAAFLALLTAFLYVLVYTPLKRMTWLNTSVGAIPGALPTLIGWAAATGRLDPGAWMFFGILFAWQHPHFYSIAWMFREDYARAGFKMLSVVDPSGRRLFRQSILHGVLLLGCTVGLHLTGVGGGLFIFGATLLGAMLLVACLGAAETHSLRDARRVLLASVVYLPLLMVLIVADAAL